MKFLDTSVAIDFLRQRADAVTLVERHVARQDLVASELVRFELLAGARSDELTEIEAFCSAFEWVPVTAEVAKTGAALARRYRPSHGGIEDVDYLLAATAIILDAELLTTNVRHFPMFPGLQGAY